MQVAFGTTVKIEQREKRAQEMMQPAVHGISSCNKWKYFVLTYLQKPIKGNSCKYI